MTEFECDVAVIGGGPAGYVCAIRAGQLGLRTVLVEKNRLGGTCLNVGCIPSKALIHAAEEFHRITRHARSNPLGISVGAPAIDFRKTLAWKDSVVAKLTQGVGMLLTRAGVKVVEGTARFEDARNIEVSGKDGPVMVRTRHAVIATGSVPVELPGLPFGGDILDSTAALALDQVPASLAVVGGGYIGLEIGIAFAKLGSKVAVFEAGPQILAQYDSEVTRPIDARLGELGIAVHTGVEVTGFADGQVAFRDRIGKAGAFSAEKVLVAVGRRPFTEGLGLENLALATEKGFIPVDGRCETAMRGLFAIGDVTPGLMLAHRGMAQGEMVAEILSGQKRQWDARAIPAVCFTDPEIVSVGLLPREAEEVYGSAVTGRFPFQANGRSLATEDSAGFIRVVARPDDHAIVGVQAVGAEISELSSAFSIAIEMGARLEDVAAIIEAHPTRSEGFAEAAMKALGHALHI